MVNTYGPTECTDVVAFHRLAPEGETVPGSSPVGRALPGFRLLVLDRNLAPLPLGVAGELTVGGVGVGAGYLGRPALTAEKFVPDPFAAEPGSRLYFTGDLARTLPGGEIDFLGRVDQQVKVRGFRIELGEVEAALAACPGVGGAAVLVREDRPGERRLVAYVERASGGPGGRATGSAELRAALGELLPEYMVPGELVVLERLPLSANGKIDRRALAELAPEATAEADGYVAPRTPAEEVMAGIWATVLGRERVGIADNFFALGGHSLLATRVVSRLREAFGVEVPLRALFASPTVAALAEVVERGWRVQSPPLQRLRHAGPVPLSFAQERLWFLDQLAPGSAAYNLAAVLRLSGPLDRPALSASLEAIVARHAALRTTFETAAGRPVQAIAPAGALPLPLTSVESLPEARREGVARHLAEAAAARPFDLARGPLVRALLLRLTGTSHLLVLALHHIVTDGWSMEVLTRELGELYGALVEGRVPALPELPIQYSDYAVWQRLWLSGAVLAEQIAWWRQRLAGAPSVLDLPGDRPRPAVASLRGDTVPVLLPAALDLRLTGIARDASATPFMALLAAYAALLNRFTGSDDLVVGSPVANRQQVATEGLIGFFVNTLPLRVGLGGRPTFAALLAAVREDTLGAYAHQDVPFEMLVEALAPARSLAHSPLFQVVLALQNAAPPVLDLAGLRLELLPAGGSTAKFDLTLALVPGRSGLAGLFEYSRDLFDHTTAMRLAGSFHRLLAAIVAAPETPVADLPLLAPAELQQLREWRGVATDYPRRSTIPALFAEQAARAPEAVALVAGIAGIGGLASGAVSYGELLSRARVLAVRLRALGVGPEVPVGLLLERSLGMVVATLAVLEAGGAYVPLDPGAPAERLSWLLGETGVPVLIVEEGRLGGLPEPFASFPAQVLSIGADGRSAEPQEERQGRAGAEPAAAAENLACLMFTSGSTGTPKGVAVVHRGVVRLVRETSFARFGPEEVFLQLAPVAFDAATLEIWGALLNGGRLVLPAPGALTPGELAEIVSRYGVTTLWLTAGLFHEVVEENLAGLRPVRQLLAGGDVLSPVQVERATAGLPGTRLINGYGPTEGTTFTSCGEVEPGSPEGPVSIGRPIDNTEVLVVDGEDRPVPIGVAGELLAGGDGLARGYWRRPDLTAERFRPNPFGSLAGGRVYRTGDRARFLASGRLEFLGRLDRQVKIRGFRIEPGEVEAVLGAHPEVAQVAVVVREDRPGDKRLVAYVVGAEGADLRGYLRDRLPEYLVPAAFVHLSLLPLTANGKLDRAALPVPERAEGPERGEAAAPRTPAEELMTGIWSEVLGIAAERIGVDDTFFELGGHSLLATRVVSRLRETFGVEVSLRAFFAQPTIGGMVREIAAVLGTGAAGFPPSGRCRGPPNGSSCRSPSPRSGSGSSTSSIRGEPPTTCLAPYAFPAGCRSPPSPLLSPPSSSATRPSVRRFGLGRTVPFRRSIPPPRRRGLCRSSTSQGCRPPDARPRPGGWGPTRRRAPSTSSKVRWCAPLCCGWRPPGRSTPSCSPCTTSSRTAGRWGSS